MRKCKNKQTNKNTTEYIGNSWSHSEIDNLDFCVITFVCNNIVLCYYICLRQYRSVITFVCDNIVLSYYIYLR